MNGLTTIKTKGQTTIDIVEKLYGSLKTQVKFESRVYEREKTKKLIAFSLVKKC